MAQDPELMRIEATDSRLFRPRHFRAQFLDQCGTRLGDGTEHLTPILTSSPRDEASALETIHEPGDARGPFQELFRNFKCRKAFRPGISEDPKDVVLLERDLIRCQVPLDCSLDPVCAREERANDGLVAG